MPSKLWKLYSEVQSYCSAASCVSGSLLNHLQQFHGSLFRFDTLHIKYNTGKPVCQQKQRHGWLGSFKDSFTLWNSLHYTQHKAAFNWLWQLWKIKTNLTNPSLWDPKKIGVQSQFSARFVPYRARAVFASPLNPPPSRHTRYDA